MPRTTLPVQPIVRTGLGPVLTVAVPTPSEVEGLTIADLAVAVPAGGVRRIGPFSSRTFEQPDGTVHVDLSAATSVTVGAFSAG